MLLDKTLYIPDLGEVGADSGFHLLPATEDGKFVAGKNGVEFVVATGDKAIKINELQLEGSKKMSASDFMLGRKLNVLQKLGE
jgi:methionyl-tRNA formyltransferase